MRPYDPVGPGIAVTCGIPKRKTSWRAFFLQSLHQLQKACSVFREAGKARGFDLTFPVDQSVASRTEGDANPFIAVSLQVLFAYWIPPSVLLTQVSGDVGAVDELFGIQIGVVIGTEDDIGPAAHVCGDRRFGADIFPALVIDADLDACLLFKLLDIGHVDILVSLDKTLPPEHAQLCAFLGGITPLSLRVLGPNHRTGSGACSSRSALQKLTTVDMRHSVPPCENDCELILDYSNGLN
ncbi:MAG: hypothetical protein EBW19_09320 [Betaproteobacteria bacterium]|nr:hypothetical protein [Betaproteobacteria bacterium]